jgi:ATP synthase protein I
VTTKRDRDDDLFIDEIRRQAKRAAVSQHMTLWQGLGLVGSVGWMVVLPALLGAFAGRFIDGRSKTGVFWTISLLFLGLVFGCLTAWRQVREELER